MNYQTIHNKNAITHVILTPALPTLEELREMGENIKNGYLYIIPPEDDRYELISFSDTGEGLGGPTKIIVKLLDGKRDGCFGFCRNVELLLDRRPGICRMKK